MSEVIASNVKKLRTSQSMTQKQFADTTGVSRSIVVNIEARKGTSVQVLEQIARRFKVAVADLVKTEPIVDKSVAGMFGADFDYDGEFDKLPAHHKKYSQYLIAMASKHFYGNNTIYEYQPEIKEMSARIDNQIARAVEVVRRSADELKLTPQQVNDLAIRIFNTSREVNDQSKP